MVYEIEKRALLSKVEFKSCREKVAKLGKYVDRFSFKSFLFCEPEYLRIRIVKGKLEAEVTKKIGNYNDTAREELNEFVKLSKLRKYISQIKKQRFTECVSIQTESEVYQFNGVSVQFNDIEFLGRIIEVEALTEDEKEIPRLKKEVTETMKLLGLKELNAKTYQKMMNEMYVKRMKPVGILFNF